MTASSSFLAQGNILQYLNYALSSLPIFFLCSLFIPPSILKQLQRIQRQCLWRKNSQEPAPSLAAWDLICRPKNKEGLLDLGFQNVALLLKHVNKFLNKEDIPWVQLSWNLCPKEQHPVGLFGGRTFSNCLINSERSLGLRSMKVILLFFGRINGRWVILLCLCSTDSQGYSPMPKILWF